MNTNPKILLIGTGAVGSYFAGRLSVSGADVSAVCRSDYDQVKANGIKVKSVNGDFLFKPRHVIRSGEEFPDKADYILVATKVLPGADVPSMIRKYVHPDTSIVLIQNGVDIEEPVRQAFPGNEIVSGLAYICVTRVAPGIVEHDDVGNLTLGKYPSGKSEKIDHLAELFTKAGVPCRVNEDIIKIRWVKLIWNAPFNPISVIAGGATTSEMMTPGPAHDLVKAVMEEVAILANKDGHPVPVEAIETTLKFTKGMKPYKTSMLMDYENGREMEVEAILGNAVRIAKKYGASVPHIESLYGALYLLNERVKKYGRQYF